MKTTIAILATILAGVLNGPAQAQILLSENYTVPDDVDLANYAQELVQSWTFSTAFQNVSISVPIGVLEGSNPSPATAYLLNKIGSGATSANIVATDAFDFPVASQPFAPTTLFSNLNLNAGTYYLFLDSNDVGSSENAWVDTPYSSITEAAGVTLGSSYVFEYPYSDQFIPGNSPTLNPVEGGTFIITLNEVPEPSVCFLGVIALSLIFVMKANKRVGALSR